MSLNKQQQTAYDSIVELFQEGPTAAVLTGAAGTGKTYLCDELTKALDPVLCALTHKAAAVLAKATGRSVVTLAKLLKQRKYNDLDTGETMFKTSSTISLPFGKRTVFIDECSMMNKANLEAVLEHVAKRYNVLFIGDKFQLPPVNENFASVFKQTIPTLELTEPVRYDPTGGIARTGTAIREAMAVQAHKIDGMREVLKECNDIEWMSSDKAVPLMLDAFRDAKEPDDVRVISFTNAQVQSFNFHLKATLTGSTDRIKEGDLLVCNETYSVGDEILLINNQSLRAHRVEEVEVEGVPCDRVDVGVCKVNVPVDIEAFGRRIENMRLTALSHPKGSTERRQHFAHMFAFKEQFADLRLNYAQTIHKSQGSSYKICFLDLTKLDVSSIQGRHLLYTGVTRAAKKLVIFK